MHHEATSQNRGSTGANREPALGTMSIASLGRWSLVLTVAASLVSMMASEIDALVTSDGHGTHLAVDSVEIDLSHRFPPGYAPPTLDHDSVGKLEFHRPDFGDTFCSSALIVTPLGKAALTAAHCLANSSGTMISSDFSLAVLDRFGVEQTFTTNDPQNVFLHPNYNGLATHGYDLAIVFFDQPISIWVPAYTVADDLTPILFSMNRIVKFGFGRTGDGVNASTLDGLKRWGLNSYELYGLGEYGLTVSGGWNHLETQVTADFDNFTLFTNNFFNFYEHFAGYFMPPSHSLYLGGTMGWGNDEAFGNSGDSGGPNFLYDETQGWVIVAVNSYRYQTSPGTLGFPGTPDINRNVFSTFGEYEGDAVVTKGLVDQVLGLAPPPAMAKPFGFSSRGKVDEGGPLGPAHRRSGIGGGILEGAARSAN